MQPPPGHAVGIGSIDALHAECETLLAELSQRVASDAAAGRALERLRDHLARHFSHEEALMAATGFPPAACHAREHASVLEVVTEVQRRYANGETDPLSRLPDAMAEWFDVHVVSMDAALAEWLRSIAAQPSEQPVA